MESLGDILARQQRNTSTSTDGHQTDGRRSSDGPTAGLPLPSEPVRPSEEEVEEKAAWYGPCEFCGIAELNHICRVAWRWAIMVPDDPIDLAHYLVSVWGIRLAELVALEVGADAVRGALAIVRRGTKEGRVYLEPAGLIVKLARRINRASDRAARGR